jgi:hypothetical protein
MKSITLYLSLFIAVVTVAGCCKTVDKTNQSYIGNWYGQQGAYYYSFEISDDGTGVWQRTSAAGIGTSTLSYNGKVCEKNGKLSVGLKKFSINKAPYMDTLTFHNYMELDGVEYSK